MVAVSFASENPLGDCPGEMEGDISKTTRGLIVLQEWWGMNEQIKKQAKEIGEMGSFITVVPDLYRGKVAIDREEAGHLVHGLDWSGAVSDIKGAAEFLKRKGCTKVGMTGFCLGGALSLMSAALLPSGIISAAAPFYGIPGADKCDLSAIAIPVQGHFGETDMIKGFSSLEDARNLEKKCSSVQLWVYKDCGHAFVNPSNPNFNKENAELALGRLVEFMNRYLV